MADADSSLTPEQRLLKLIEDPQAAIKAPRSEAAKAKGPVAGPEKKKAPSKPSVNLAAMLSPEAIRGKIEYAKDFLVGVSKGDTEKVSVAQISRLVQWIVIGFGIYLAAAVIYEVCLAYKDYGSEFKAEPKEMAEIAGSEGKMVDPNLFEEVEKRNIFVALEKRQSFEAVEIQETPLKLVELTKDLKLAGISLNEKDPARTFCMIEDLKKNVTNFLKVGDTISGLRVDQINHDGIVLKHQKESIELR